MQFTSLNIFPNKSGQSWYMLLYVLNYVQGNKILYITIYEPCPKSNIYLRVTYVTRKLFRLRNLSVPDVYNDGTLRRIVAKNQPTEPSGGTFILGV